MEANTDAADKLKANNKIARFFLNILFSSWYDSYKRSAVTN